MDRCLIRKLQRIQDHLQELHTLMQHPHPSTHRVLCHLQALQEELRHLQREVVRHALPDHLHDPDWVVEAHRQLRHH
ncbi:hypothetical protein [Deinococcus cellulosilyticus]|uniref:Uncharacterized protein n=1 Tax=Deinococcus cellulosilyticus (strain DSM 18568 / NBRC 106333 / KACC 11606 / 5516J-15) TaxID=1223518 RepID=A0A511N1D5_DEIC1|nr:hypothetical protein [Deinococcus cellulosilyticus]GEM46683.1 hypothetical protein DC3_23180 [Deinococcus cellulosilyticus NBRC 106333 = KACC 11606]